MNNEPLAAGTIPSNGMLFYMGCDVVINVSIKTFHIVRDILVSIVSYQ